MRTPGAEATWVNAIFRARSSSRHPSGSSEAAFAAGVLAQPWSNTTWGRFVSRGGPCLAGRGLRAAGAPFGAPAVRFLGEVELRGVGEAAPLAEGGLEGLLEGEPGGGLGGVFAGGFAEDDSGAGGFGAAGALPGIASSNAAARVKRGRATCRRVDQRRLRRNNLFTNASTSLSRPRLRV